MKNRILVLYFALIIVGLGCNQNKVKKEVKVAAKETELLDSTSAPIEWMKLNNSWVPVITEVDKLLNSGKKYYTKKEFKESASKITMAQTIIEGKTKNKNAHKELLNSSRALTNLSKKVENGNINEAEMDSVLYRVCDVHMKNCWILKDKETDLWVFDENLQIHLDSTLYYSEINDSIKAQEELSKARWIIDAENHKYCDPEGKKISDQIGIELNSIKHALIKGERATIGKVKIRSALARTYFLKSDRHYSRANQLSLMYGDDRMEGDLELAREIKASVFYLERALNTKGIVLTEKESFHLENGLLIGNELLGGYTHPKEDITDSIKEIGKIMLKYRSKFLPETI